MTWNFNAEEGKANMNGFPLIPVGDHRVRISKVDDKDKNGNTLMSKTGKEMISITLDVSGHPGKLFNYLVFDDTSNEARQRTNGNLMKIFDSFSITPGDMNYQNWIGKVGACRVKHEIYNGETKASVAYFKLKKDQVDLPPWQEKTALGSQQPASTYNFEADDIQF